MPEYVQAVVAGSKAFVDALDAHLRLRLGATPLLARSPAEALKACAGDGALLVLEYGGPDWLEAVKSLRSVRDRATLPIVVAVPSSRMAELGALQRAGVDEAVRWDARVDPVLWAIDRIVMARPHRPAPEASAGGDPGASVRAAAEPEVAPERRDVVASAPPAPPAALAPLPAELPPDEGVVKLLRAALAHEAGGDEGWRLFTERVASQLGDMERVALSGAPFPLDAAPLRASACLRWRIAAVLARTRATGSPPAPEMANELPVEVDTALSALKALAEAADAELRPGIEAARNALVREAIGFTDAVAAALAPAEAQAVTSAPAGGKKPAARLITNENAEETVRRRPIALWIALAVALIVALGYHANRLYHRPGPTHADFLGAPANTIGSDRGLKVFSALPGKKIDPRELERLRAAERAKGNVVKEIGPGTYVIKPEAAQARGGSRP